MFERFTADARHLTVDAQEVAVELGAARIEPIHLLLAVFERDAAAVERLRAAGLTAAVLRAAASASPDVDADDSRLLGAIGIDVDRIRRAIDERFGDGTFDAADRPAPRSRRRSHLPFARTAKRSLEMSLREALRLKDNRIDTGHIVLGILGADDPVIDAVIDEDTRWTLRRGLEDDLRGAA